MELITFKTNIKNEAALSRIARHLNQVVGATNWQLDINSHHHYLTVFSPGILNGGEVRKLIRKEGFKAEPIQTIHTMY